MDKINIIRCMDALEGLKGLPDSSVHLVVTSPPYADIKLSYGHIAPEKYVEWFAPIGQEILRILTPDGSFILNINDKYQEGVRIPYSFELMFKLKELKFNLIDIICWAKSKGAPNVAGRRGSNYWEPIFHFCKSNKPIWNVDAIRTPYPQSSLKRAQKPIKVNVSNKEGRLANKEVAYKQWKLHPAGAWPKNVLHFPQAIGKDEHPASFHIDLPTYFIKAHSNPGDIVLDPFAGKGTTLLAAKNLGRQYLGFDLSPDYVKLAQTKYGL